MQLENAIKIVNALANGVDIYTGEIYPEESPYQKPQVIRALFMALDVLKNEYNRAKKKRKLPENAGKPWTEDQDKNLLELYNEGKEINEIAKMHKRTRYSIEARLEKFGKISRTWSAENRQ